MSNTCIVLKAIENVSQLVADFLPNPALFTGDDATFLINQIELVAGSVRELPVTAALRADILGRLVEIQTILQNGTLSLTTINRLLAVLQLLQVVALKVANRKVPCTQGFAEIRPSNVFNTACCPCK
ncbi:MAG TPA: hypothetical protein VEC37_09750 [Bacillota bacterium]|nr:hypothetical protein [Bacillota bacterium]